MTPHLREGDVEEIHASTGKRAGYALLQSYTISTWAKVAVNDRDFPVAMFGLCVQSPAIGVPWMIVTNEFPQIVRPFRRQCRMVVEEMQDQCAMLANMVLATNTTAQRWLEWCGFTIHYRPTAFGPFNKLFYPFTRQRSV